MGLLNSMILAASLATLQGPLIAGEAVEGHEFADTAAVVYTGGLVACSGVLIDKDVVVTARHCALGPVENVALDTQDISEPGEIIPVTHTWFPSDGKLDLAFLFLTEPSTVSPRSILQGCEGNFLAGTPSALVAGFGATDPEGLSWDGLLRSGIVEIQNETCPHSTFGCEPGLPPNAELIAQGEVSDTCTGDSGGPLYVETDSGTFLAGVTSRGLAQGTLPCGQGGIYIRLDTLIETLQEEMGRELPTVDCTVLDYAETKQALEHDGSLEPRNGCAHGTSSGPALLFLLLFARLQTLGLSRN